MKKRTNKQVKSLENCSLDNNKIGVIGGDLRQLYLIEELALPVICYGNNKVKNIQVYNDLDSFLDRCNTIVTSIPFTKDGENLFTPFWDEKISIKHLISKLSDKHILIGGPFLHTDRYKEFKWIDITRNCKFKELNAYLTAEGVISKMIEKLTIALCDSNVIVLGYGYCGKKISEYTSMLGAETTVFTIKDNEVKECENKGYKVVVNPGNIILKDYDYIINTIPAKLIELEEDLNNDYIFLDITNIYESGNKDWFIKMRGIPGTYSPKTSGKIIGSVIKEIIKEVKY